MLHIPVLNRPTKMRSASMTVDRRCATMTVVTRERSAARLLWMDASVRESSALVACRRERGTGCKGKRKSARGGAEEKMEAEDSTCPITAVGCVTPVCSLSSSSGF